MNAELSYAGHRLFARSGGEGPALLLIHGFPTSSRDWEPLWPALSPRWTLHAIDMLGFGLSDKPSDFDYSVPASADQWEALCAARGLTKVHVLAHDYGVTVAQELLARQLERKLPFSIRSIAFLNGGLFPEATHPLRIQKWLLGPFGSWVARFASERTFVAGMRRICVRPMDDAELHEHWERVVRAGGRRVMPKLIRYIRERSRQRERWVGALLRADVPICLIDGVDDPVSGADTVRRWRELLPQAPVHQLSGVGHYPQWEAPGAVLAAFEAFHRSVLG